jgi:hypothetical protein
MAAEPAPALGRSACTAIPLPGAGTRIGDLVFEGGFQLVGTTPGFGGLSGLAAAAPDRLLAATDSGDLVSISLSVTAEGTPAAHCRITPLETESGRGLGEKSQSDSEGLAVLGPDRIAVSFERNHRIATFALGEDARSDGAIVDFDGQDGLDGNEGLEALAILSSGAILAGAESISITARPHPVWRLEPTGDPTHPFAQPQAATFTLPGAPGFGLVGFDQGPDGGLFVLERFYSDAIGNRVRILRLAPGVAETARGRARPVELAGLRPGGALDVDNFEGIAATAGPDGGTILWIVSDDNFSSRQKTLLYRFSYDPDGGRSSSAASLVGAP